MLSVFSSHLIIRAEDNVKFSQMMKRFESDAAPRNWRCAGEMIGLWRYTQFPVEVAIKSIQLPLKEVFTVYVRDISSRKERKR